MSALLLRDLTVERGGRAVLKEVSVEIPDGQVTALLGPNGAGKSTLVLAVGGVLRPKAGAVLLAGTELAGRRPERIGRHRRHRPDGWSRLRSTTSSGFGKKPGGQTAGSWTRT